MVLLAGVSSQPLGPIILVLTAAFLTAFALWMFWPEQAGGSDGPGPFDDHLHCTIAQLLAGGVATGTRVRVRGRPSRGGERYDLLGADDEGSLTVVADVTAGQPRGPGKLTWIAGEVIRPTVEEAAPYRAAGIAVALLATATCEERVWRRRKLQGRWLAAVLAVTLVPLVTLLYMQLLMML
jgi:hypothetical protein